MQAINTKTIAAFWAQCAEGTRLTCLANTYNHKAPGVTGVITKPGKTSLRLTGEDGRHFYINPPRRVRDVVSMTDDAMTYYIGCDEHTATWRIDR